MSFLDSISSAASSLKNKIVGAVAPLYDAAATKVEADTLKSMGLPDFLVTWLQRVRADFGFAPIVNPAYLYLIGAVILLIFGGLMQYVFGIFTRIIGIYGDVIQGNKVSKWKIIFFCLTVGFLISITMYYFFVKPILKTAKVDVAKDLAKVFGESFVNPVPETSLINLQSIAIKQTGFIGPSENEGTFDVATGIQSVLRTGTRFFILQISYLESQKDSKHFDEPYLPTLVYRDDSGVLISANGANIKAVATTLANYAFAPSVKSSTQPLIVYLHFERTPNQLRTPEKYVKFLSSVAQMLEPLEEHMIGHLPEGSFKRQQNETNLLNSPIGIFEQKAIILCNVDTSIFRNLSVLGMAPIDQKYDLDYLVNLRVYLDDNSDSLGATSAPIGNVIPNAVIVPFNRINSMDETEQDVFALKGKARYVIAMPSQIGNPSVDSISKLIKNCGVNSIALNLFGEDTDVLKEKIKIWGGEPFYTIKPANYRAIFLEK